MLAVQVQQFVDDEMRSLPGRRRQVEEELQRAVVLAQEVSMYVCVCVCVYVYTYMYI